VGCGRRGGGGGCVVWGQVFLWGGGGGGVGGWGNGLLGEGVSDRAPGGHPLLSFPCEMVFAFHKQLPAADRRPKKKNEGSRGETKCLSPHRHELKLDKADAARKDCFSSWGALPCWLKQPVCAKGEGARLAEGDRSS